LAAFIKLNLSNVNLIFMGDGELRTIIEEEINAEDVKNVLITGFINQSEISNYYALADLFVLQ
jgi:glycosyltransferase involved in cell wall biosynthesis